MLPSLASRLSTIERLRGMAAGSGMKELRDWKRDSGNFKNFKLDIPEFCWI